MSLLDTFTILFDTDSKKSSKDVDDLNKKLDDTEQSAKKATDGIDSVGESANKTGSMLADLTKMAGTALASFLALSAIKSQITETAQMSDEIGKFGQTLGLNIKQLDAWGEAAARNGGSASSFRSTVGGLQQQLTQIQFGGGTGIIESLGKVGVSAFDANGNLKDTFDILGELADRFKQMPAPRAYALGTMLGLDQGTILMLQQGRYQIEQLVKQQLRLGSASNKSYIAAANFDDAMDNLDRSFRSIWQSINTFVLPPITMMINAFNSIVTFMRENQDFAVGFFAVIGGAALAAVPPMVELALSVLGVTWPLLAIIAAVIAVGAAFGLVYDDIMHYLHGEDSMIGRLLDRFPLIGVAAKETAQFIEAAFRQLKAVFDWFVLLIESPQEAIDELKGWLGDIGQVVWSGVKNGTIEAFTWLKKQFTDFLAWVKSIFDLSFIGDKIKGAFNSVKSFFGKKTSSTGQVPTVADNTAAMLATMGVYNTNPLNAGSSVVTNSNSSRTVNHYNNFSFRNQIDANNMTPEQFQNSFSDEFGRQLAAASGHFDDGVDL